MQFVGRTILGNTLLVGGFNPSEKYDRQIGSFPQFSGWKKNKSETTTLITLPESLKLTFSHLQMDGWNKNRFPNWGSAYFLGDFAVSFRGLCRLDPGPATYGNLASDFGYCGASTYP